LVDGVSQLQAGSSSFGNGLEKYAFGVSQVGEGASKLANGANQLNANSAALNEGSSALVKGTEQLASNLPTLSNGVIQLADGAGKINEGSSALAEGSGKLGEGISSLPDGTVGLSEKLSYGAKEISEYKTTDDNYSMIAEPTQVKEQKSSDVPNYGHALAPYVLSLGLFALTATLVMILSTIPPLEGNSFSSTFSTRSSSTCVMLSVYFTSVPTGIFKYT